MYVLIVSPVALDGSQKLRLACRTRFLSHQIGYAGKNLMLKPGIHVLGDKQSEVMEIVRALRDLPETSPHFSTMKVALLRPLQELCLRVAEKEQAELMNDRFRTVLVFAASVFAMFTYRHEYGVYAVIGGAFGCLLAIALYVADRVRRKQFRDQWSKDVTQVEAT